MGPRSSRERQDLIVNANQMGLNSSEREFVINKHGCIRYYGLLRTTDPLLNTLATPLSTAVNGTTV